jgi:hypothetical protein
MTDRETILAAFRFTQMYAEKLAADLTDEELTMQPQAGMNHAAWVLGMWRWGRILSRCCWVSRR